MRAAVIALLVVFVVFAATMTVGLMNADNASCPPAPTSDDPDDFEGWEPCDWGIADGLAQHAPGIKLTDPIVVLTDSPAQREIAAEEGTRIAHVEITSGIAAIVEFECRPNDGSKACNPKKACLCAPGTVIADAIAMAQCAARGVAHKFVNGRCNHPRISFVIPPRNVVLTFTPLAGRATLEVK